MPRAASPDDLYRLRVATDPRLSPDGRAIVFAVQTVAPTFDGYRQALWSVPADGSAPARQLTLGAKHDRHARFSPDGRTLAFLSDRRAALEEPPEGVKPTEREDSVQVHLLPLDGGEARQLTDLPRGVDGFAWAPDGRRLVVTTSSRAADREAEARARGRRPRKPGTPPPSDYRYLDRLGYLFNGAGFVDDRETHLWIVDAESGEATRLTDGPGAESAPAWSPDGTRIAFVADHRAGRDITFRSNIYVVDVASGRQSSVTVGRAAFYAPAWLDDATVLALGHRFPARAGSRSDVWRFAADGSDATPAGGRNLTARHDLMIGSTMNSDVVPGEEPRLVVAADGTSVLAIAPIDGAEELWRISTDDGGMERLTHGHHYVSSFDAVAGPRGGTRVALLRSSATTPSDVHRLDVQAAPTPRPLEPVRVTELNAAMLDELTLVEPEERWSEVDGRRIQGWYYPPVAATGRPGGRGRRGTSAALVTQIHGGPHTHYGWAPIWEWQVLVGSGIGVFACNPRGSDGYGEAFNAANYRDWGDGPTRDILAGVDDLVAEGRADPDRLGVTGGSYGGYLTTWIISRDQRFRAAMACRGVNDMTTLMLTGDIASGEWARLEFGAAPWEDPDYYREVSPLSYAKEMRTPLLIQHSEHDLRTTIGQAEALFTVLRSLRRPVRLMRVPGESHELTRSGTPFRRVENIVQVRDWFRWFLVEGNRRLPPRPRSRAGR
jgi:dipeptidyl aminopeptidase/acylaminoacyl peptidase